MVFSKLSELITKFRTSSNIKNGLIFSFFAFLNNGVNFIMLMLLADLLVPDSYGILNLFNTAITILTVLIPLGCTGFVAVSFFRTTREEFVAIINAIFAISTTVFILFLLFLLIAQSYLDLDRVIGFSFNFQIIALSICFFQLFSTINLDIWRLQEKPIAYGLYSLGIIVLNFLLTFLFLLGFKMDWKGRAYAQLIAVVIFFIISTVFLFRRRFLTFQKIQFKVIKEALLFGIPLIPHTLSSWIRQGLDRYILNFFWSSTVVGFFSFALNFGNIIHIIGIAFNLSNSVFIYKKLANRDSNTKKIILKQTYIMTVIFFAGTMVVFLSSYLLIPYVFPKYIESLPYLFPLCLAAFFQCIYYLFVNYLFYFKKTKILMYITFSVSITHLLLSFILTKYCSIFTAYISLFSNFVICILVFFISQKYYPIYKKK